MMLQNPGTWRPPAHENIVGFRPDEPEVSEEGWGAEVTCQPLTRNCGLLPSRHMSEHHWKQILQPQLSLQMTQPWATP